ncbi:FGGY-family carbohydrate kinase [Tistrella bauzanensis]
MTFGTGGFALVVTGRRIATGGAGPLATIAWQKAGAAPVHALDGGVYCASSAVNWARGLGLFDDYAAIRTFEAPSAISRGLVFVPALAGLACPHWDRRARGAWMGLSLDTTPADMMQALLEGVAFRMAEVVDTMTAHQPLADPVSIDGGMAANDYFCQMLADCLGRPVMVQDEPEMTAVGTAVLAAEAVGQAIASHRPGLLVTPRPLPPGLHDRFRAARAAVQAFGAA